MSSSASVRVLAALSVAALAALFAPGLHGDAHAEATAAGGTLAVATFAGGCFWCTESDFEHLDGVVGAVSGYTGGSTPHPTYEEVGSGGTGHAESVEVTYDPAKVSYAKLLDYYWRHVDVLDGGGQFCDRGDQYRPVIFTHNADEQKQAEESKAALDTSGRFAKPIAVQIRPATTFTPAEDYHQDYYKKNPFKYKFYRTGCGRDQRLKALWGAEAGS